MITLEQLNATSQAEFTALLDGTYEHSPWIAEAAWQRRPFVSLPQLKRALVDALIELRMYTEAALDFPDEEVEFLRAGGVIAYPTDSSYALGCLIGETPPDGLGPPVPVPS